MKDMLARCLENDFSFFIFHHAYLRLLCCNRDDKVKYEVVCQNTHMIEVLTQHSFWYSSGISSGKITVSLSIVPSGDGLDR